MSAMQELEFREGFAGACYVNGTGICVAQPEDYCDEGTFASAHFMRARVGDVTHPLRYCAGAIESVLIGRCRDSGECSNLASRCEDSSTFQEVDEDCTITQDLLSETYVTYGKCGERCVWSPEYCLEGETYISNDPECTANKVEIGACFAGHAFCAVGPKSCTHPGLPDEPFWSHEKVQELTGANCFLSYLPEPPRPPTTTAPPTRQPTRQPENWRDSMSDPPTESPIEILEPSSNGRLSTNGLVGIVAAVAVILGIAIGAGAVYCRRRREEDDAWKVDKNREQDSVPTGVVETSQQMEMEYAESAITDPDFKAGLSEENQPV